MSSLLLPCQFLIVSEKIKLNGARRPAESLILRQKPVFQLFELFYLLFLLADVAFVFDLNVDLLPYGGGQIGAFRVDFRQLFIIQLRPFH